ncbi:hypothetical protein OF83DRAFT_625110 [Amylostereum chailletii]|nr:hypothetical protein OF83DRAFT_625110 [Amylostereum chailletii]
MRTQRRYRYMIALRRQVMTDSGKPPYARSIQSQGFVVAHTDERGLARTPAGAPLRTNPPTRRRAIDQHPVPLRPARSFFPDAGSHRDGVCGVPPSPQPIAWLSFAASAPGSKLPLRERTTRLPAHAGSREPPFLVRSPLLSILNPSLAFQSRETRTERTYLPVNPHGIPVCQTLDRPCR